MIRVDHNGISEGPMFAERLGRTGCDWEENFDSDIEDQDPNEKVRI